MMLKTSVLAVLGLTTMAVDGHMLLNLPVPFPSQSKADGQNGRNGPLYPDGRNFPCKSTGPETYEGGTATPMPLGSIQPLQFMGGATHSGGSCQISITYDTAPTKSSTWKVLHSIHGGCPNAFPGNLGDDANAITPGNYKFTIPKDIPTGKAVLAWTWINKTGNREFYMNCAPIEITSPKSKRSDEADILAQNATQLIQRDTAAFDALPNMFVANLPEADCSMHNQTESVRFFDPGSSLESLEGEPLRYPSGPKCVTAVAAPTGGSGSGSGASPVATAPAQTSLPGGVFATIAPQVPAPAPAQSSTATVAPKPVTSAAPSAAPSPAPAAPGGSGSSLTGACTSEGMWNCIGGTTFQRCASGTWSAAQPVAAGTKCTVGTSEAIIIEAVAKAKRAIRFSHAHALRHFPIPQ